MSEETPRDAGQQEVPAATPDRELTGMPPEQADWEADEWPTSTDGKVAGRA